MKDNDALLAWLLGWIIWAYIVKWVNIPEINIPNLDIKIPEIEVDTRNISDAMEKLWDALGSKLWIGVMTYVFTMFPMRYKLELLEAKLAETTAEYEWWKALYAEIKWLSKAISEEDLGNLDSYINTSNTEWKNRLMHQALVNSGLFQPGEVTWVKMSEVKKVSWWFELKVDGKWEEEKSQIFINWEAYYIEKWDDLKITLDKDWKNAKIVSWTISIPRTWADDKLVIGEKLTYVETSSWWDDEEKILDITDPIAYLRTLSK